MTTTIFPLIRLGTRTCTSRFFSLYSSHMFQEGSRNSIKPEDSSKTSSSNQEKSSGIDYSKRISDITEIRNAAPTNVNPDIPKPRFNSTFQNGDFYSPMDLAYKKPGRRQMGRRNSSKLFSNDLNSNLYPPKAKDIRQIDPFLQHDIDPLALYKNRGLMSLFVSEMGKIMPRSQTGLSAKSQRKVTKAIKRARAAGFIPYHSRPHQVLKSSQNRSSNPITNSNKRKYAGY